LLRFKVYQLQLGPRHYLLLPKMNGRQMEVIEQRLAKKGFSVRLSGSLVAKSREGVLHLNPSGTCWSAFDPGDLILPAVPEVLEAPKEHVPLRTLQSVYFKTGGSAKAVRLSTRIESGSNWDRLRAAGECGLCPDEHAVATFLISRAGGTCELLTDFFTEGASPRLCGRKRYFDSALPCREVASTLRVAGGDTSRNSYLRRDNMLRLKKELWPSKSDLSELFHSLGEWCSFIPK
jgi:hypothetical protein